MDMKVIVEIPDTIAGCLPDQSLLPRLILEAYCAERFRRNLVTRHDVGVLLGLDQQETDKFIETNGASATGGSSHAASSRVPQETSP